MMDDVQKPIQQLRADNDVIRPSPRPSAAVEEANSSGIAVKPTSPVLGQFRPSQSAMAAASTQVKQALTPKRRRSIADRAAALLPKSITQSTLQNQEAEAPAAPVVASTGTSIAARLRAHDTQLSTRRVEGVMGRQLARASQNQVAIATTQTGLLASIHQFNSGPMLTYMTKSLTLSYQRNILAQDQLALLSSIGEVLESKLEAIKKNTGAPEIRKTSLLDQFKQKLQGEAIGRVTKRIGDVAEKHLINPALDASGKFLKEEWQGYYGSDRASAKKLRRGVDAAKRSWGANKGKLPSALRKASGKLADVADYGSDRADQAVDHLTTEYADEIAAFKAHVQRTREAMGDAMVSGADALDELLKEAGWQYQDKKLDLGNAAAAFADKHGPYAKSRARLNRQRLKRKARDLKARVKDIGSPVDAARAWRAKRQGPQAEIITPKAAASRANLRRKTAAFKSTLFRRPYEASDVEAALKDVTPHSSAAEAKNRQLSGGVARLSGPKRGGLPSVGANTGPATPPVAPQGYRTQDGGVVELSDAEFLELIDQLDDPLDHDPFADDQGAAEPPAAADSMPRFGGERVADGADYLDLTAESASVDEAPSTKEQLRRKLKIKKDRLQRRLNEGKLGVVSEKLAPLGARAAEVGEALRSGETGRKVKRGVIRAADSLDAALQEASYDWTDAGLDEVGDDSLAATLRTARRFGGKRSERLRGRLAARMAELEKIPAVNPIAARLRQKLQNKPEAAAEGAAPSLKDKLQQEVAPEVKRRYEQARSWVRQTAGLAPAAEASVEPISETPAAAPGTERPKTPEDLYAEFTRQAEQILQAMRQTAPATKPPAAAAPATGEALLVSPNLAPVSAILRSNSGYSRPEVQASYDDRSRQASPGDAAFTQLRSTEAFERYRAGVEADRAAVGEALDRLSPSTDRLGETVDHWGRTQAELLEQILASGGMGGGGGSAQPQGLWAKTKALPGRAVKAGAKGAWWLTKAAGGGYWGMAKFAAKAPVRAMRALVRKRDTDPFTDVYRGDSKEPLLTAKQLRQGLVFADDGRPVMAVNQIDRPVLDPVSKQLVINQEDLDAGLHDVNGQPLSKHRSRQSALGAGVRVGMFGVRTAGSVAKAAVGLGSPLLNLYGKGLGLAAKGAFGVGRFAGKASLGLIKALPGIAGAGASLASPILGLYASMLRGAGNLAMAPLRWIGGKLTGKKGDGAGSEISRKDLREVVGERLDDIYELLSAHFDKKTSGDADGDGVRDGSYQDQMKKLAERRKSRQDKEVAEAQKASGGLLGGLGRAGRRGVGALAGLLGLGAAGGAPAAEAEGDGGSLTGDVAKAGLGAWVASKLPGVKAAAGKVGGAVLHGGGKWGKLARVGALAGGALWGANKMFGGGSAPAPAANANQPGGGTPAKPGMPAAPAAPAANQNSGPSLGDVALAGATGYGATALAGQTAGKLLGKAVVKEGAEVGAKSLAKKIPLIGTAAGAAFAFGRLLDGDLLGAGAELTSGLIANIPGYGTAGSVMIDAWLGYHDLSKPGQTSAVVKLIKTRLDAYGIPADDKLIDYTLALEKAQVGYITARKQLTEGDIKSVAGHFGFNLADDEQVKYFAAWYTRRFGRLLLLYLRCLKDAGIKFESVPDMTEEQAAKVETAFSKEAGAMFAKYPGFLPTPAAFAEMKKKGELKNLSGGISLGGGAKPSEFDPFAADKTQAKVDPNIPTATGNRDAAAAQNRPAPGMTPWAAAANSNAANSNLANVGAARSTAQGAAGGEGGGGGGPGGTTGGGGSGGGAPTSGGGAGSSYSGSAPAGNELGALSAKYESSRKGSMAIGWDSTGGTSYGKYQIASKTGTMARFLAWLRKKGGNAATVAERLTKAGSPETGSTGGAMPEEWKRLVQEGLMGDLEHEFIKASHYDPAFKALSPQHQQMVSGSKALQDVLWSTSVQHGPGGAAKIFSQSLAPNQTPEDLIDRIYKVRGTKFGRSTAAVQASVQKRFERERADALAMLKSGAGQQPAAANGNTAVPPAAAPAPGGDAGAGGGPTAPAAGAAGGKAAAGPTPAATGPQAAPATREGGGGDAAAGGGGGGPGPAPAPVTGATGNTPAAPAPAASPTPTPAVEPAQAPQPAAPVAPNVQVSLDPKAIAQALQQALAAQATGQKAAPDELSKSLADLTKTLSTAFGAGSELVSAMQKPNNTVVAPVVNNAPAQRPANQLGLDVAKKSEYRR